MLIPQTNHLICLRRDLRTAGSGLPSRTLIPWIFCSTGAWPVRGDIPHLSDLRCGSELTDETP